MFGQHYFPFVWPPHVNKRHFSHVCPVHPTILSVGHHFIRYPSILDYPLSPFNFTNKIKYIQYILPLPRLFPEPVLTHSTLPLSRPPTDLEPPKKILKRNPLQSIFPRLKKIDLSPDNKTVF